MTTSAAERVQKLWREIDAWFEEHGAAQNLRARRPGASERALAGLERATGVALPADYRASLAVHDGGGYFESYEYLSIAGVARVWQGWHDAQASGELAKRPMVAPGAVDRWWSDGWLPFAADSCGNLHCIDAGPRPRLLALETQDAQGVYVLRGPKTFADWLGAYRDKLASGALAVDDEGFVDEPRLRPSVE
ncbi:MAG TPA: SMI1/KNR4 family protein, partial [Polyangiaceae bacterium]|nr:SMI1/KNR4 family protein [Polyangiaceae bacterium]